MMIQYPPTQIKAISNYMNEFRMIFFESPQVDSKRAFDVLIELTNTKLCKVSSNQ